MQSYELISLDIWDTILRRDCHPDAIKVETAAALLENRVNLVLIVKALRSALLPQITLYRLAQTKQRPCTPVLLLE